MISSVSFCEIHFEKKLPRDKEAILPAQRLTLLQNNGLENFEEVAISPAITM